MDQEEVDRIVRNLERQKWLNVIILGFVTCAIIVLLW